MDLLTFQEQSRKRLGFGTAFPESCYLGKVCYLWRRRNAYNANESLNDFPGSHQLRLEKLLSRAKSERGSQWFIEELPAVVISSQKVALLVISDTWSAKPLESLSQLRELPYEMSSLSEGFTDLVVGEGQTFFARASKVRPAALPFWDHTPKVSNGRRTWRMSRRDVDLKPYLTLVAKFNRLLQLQ